MNIGSISIDLLANVARLQADMDAVRRAVGGTMADVTRATDLAKNALGALGITLGVGAFVGWIKGAIDAADATKQLAEKTGLATQDIAGIKLAFQQAGLGGDGMASSMAKLSRQMVEGNKTFDALGIKTRNVDGTMRSTKDVLYDVADAFQGLEGGAAKAALAQEVWGKSGADMIPLLNGGSEGMREMADMAERLGLVIDKDTADAADRFNDTTELLGLGLQGVATQVMVQLIPTLSSLAGMFLEAMTRGDMLRQVADVLGVGLKALYSVAAGLVQVFSTVGKTIGAAAAQVVAVMSGNFSLAKSIGDNFISDIKSDWSGTIENLGKVWTDSGGESVEAMSAVNRAGRQLALQTKEQESATKAAAAEAKKHSAELEKLHKAGLDLIASTRAKNDVVQKELDLGRGLSDSEKALLDLEQKLREGKVRLTAEELRLARAEIERSGVLAEQQRITDLANKSVAEATAERLRLSDATVVATVKLVEETEAQRRANETLRTGIDTEARHTVETLLAASASAERAAMVALESAEGEVLYSQLMRQSEALRELAALKEEGIHVQSAIDANAEWKKTTESIESGLTDALMRAFEGGKGFADAFKETLINAFKTMVLQPVIRAVMQPVTGAAGSMFGGSAYAGSGSGGDMLSQFSSMFGGGSSGFGSMLGSMGQYFQTGATSVAANGVGTTWNAVSSLWSNGAQSNAIGMGGGALAGMAGGFMAGRGIGQAISGGYGLGGGSGNTAVNIGAAIGAIWGPIGSIVGGAIGGLVNRAFGMGKKEVKESGIVGTVLEGDTTAQAYAEWKQKGGWFRSDKSGTNLTALEADQAAGLDAATTLLYQQTQGLAAALGMANNGLSKVSYNLRIKLGEDEEENQKAMAEAFGSYQNALAFHFSGALAPFQRAGETWTEVMQRMAGLQLFSDGINEFGGVFSRVANLSVSAKEELLGFAGGIEAFVAKTQSFVGSYYSQDEQYGMAARGVKEQLAGLGITQDITSLAQMRALVEGTDLSTSAGREQLNALLDIAAQFAPIGQYIETNGGSLFGLAGQAPATALVASVLADQEANAAYQQAQAALVQRQVDAAEATNRGIANMATLLADKLEELRLGIVGGFEAQRAATQEAAYMNES